MASIRSLAPLASLLAVLPAAMAGFDATGTGNIAVYWGQNSYNQGSGGLAQQRLSYYCGNTDIDIIPISFLNGISPLITNFANAGDNCTAFESNADLLDCPQIEEDIIACQDTYDKTILLSLGGATYTQGGWSSTADAEAAAQSVWDTFGPVNDAAEVDRPFGSAVVDGIDFDFESTVNNIEAFGAKLRTLMDDSTAGGAKYFYLSAAPQCVYPDAADGPALDGSVFFDFIMIQFYNNGCGVANYVDGADEQWNYNFATWDDWAKNTSVNPDVRILMGIAANTGAANGYVEGTQLSSVITFTEQYTSFAGVMLWDMSQLYANDGFLAEIAGDLA